MDEKLLPCPFCGTAGERMGYHETVVACPDEKCPISHFVMTPEEWNRRGLEQNAAAEQKRRKMHGEKVDLTRCENCHESMVPPTGRCIQCGHTQGIVNAPAAPSGVWVPEANSADCHDCGRVYGDEHGFPDLVIPNYIWKRISPSEDEGGLLCPSCICKRLHVANISNVEAAFMSGPIQSVTGPTMTALRIAENLQERLDRIERASTKEPK